MSGAEPLAIIGCVFGLIQAYDAAQRTVSGIKARRADRKASQPSVHLERSLERGKKEIENLVDTGRERFGPTYLSEKDEDVGKKDRPRRHFHALLTSLSPCRECSPSDHKPDLPWIYATPRRGHRR